MVKLAAALFEPDKSRYNMSAANDLLNVLPVADGWAPMPGPSQLTPALYVLTDEDGNPLLDELGQYLVELVSGAAVDGVLFLPEPSRGGIFIRLTDGTAALFVGTSTKLYRFNFTDFYWEDVSGSSAPYTADNRWSFTLYATTVYAQNGTDPEQMFEVSGDTVFSDNVTAPIASYIATVADFVMRGRLASDPNSVQWSSLDDPQSNTVLTRGSDVQPFGEGNGIQGIIPVSSGAVVFLRDAVELMSYPDEAYVFRRSPVTKYRGAMAPASIRSIGQDDFVFYAADGFFRGLSMTPIGAQRVDQYILDICDQTARQNMISAADLRRKIVWFRVLTTDGTYRILGYNWQLDRWCLSDVDLVDMFGAETVGLTIGGLGNMFETFDDINISFNSSLFDGGAMEFAGVDSNGALVYLSGESMQATISTNEAAMNGFSHAFNSRGWLDGDAVNYSVILSTAAFRGAPFRARSPVMPSLRSGSVPIRGDGVIQKLKIIIPQGEDWTTFLGIEVKAEAGGEG